MTRRKKMRKQRKHRTGWNRHHILYQARKWSTPYAKMLRLSMTREVPIRIHDELHSAVLKDIPKPAEKLLETAWKAYVEQKTIIDAYNIKEVILWLYNAIPDEAFRACMMVQYHFFDEKMGGR